MDDDYREAGESFNFSSLCLTHVDDQDEENDDDILKAEENILKQLNKEHKPVSLFPSIENGLFICPLQT